MQPQEPVKVPEGSQKNLVPLFVIGGVTVILIIATILISVTQKKTSPSSSINAVAAPTSAQAQSYQNPYTPNTVTAASPTDAYQNPFAPTTSQTPETSDQ